jgi:hypothetical protein
VNHVYNRLRHVPKGLTPWGGLVGLLEALWPLRGAVGEILGCFKADMAKEVGKWKAEAKEMALSTKKR